MASANHVLLSICIPTYKRPEIIRELLISINKQNVDHKYYEIRITDNSETDETKEIIEKEFSNVDNLYYKKTYCKGFYNSIEALKFGTGEFLKLHNDYSLFLPGSLDKMIQRVRSFEYEKPQLFFALGSLRRIRELEEFDDYASFLDCVTYFETWSSSFAMWKCDFDRIVEEGIVPDVMFPHTSFLHRVADKSKFVVDNFKYVKNIEPKKKGGYNLIDNFVRIYLTMVEEDLLQKNYITRPLYKKVENDILKFCAGWYYTTLEKPEKYTFSFDDAEKIIYERCGDGGVSLYRGFLAKRRIIHYIKVIWRLFLRN